MRYSMLDILMNYKYCSTRVNDINIQYLVSYMYMKFNNNDKIYRACMSVRLDAHCTNVFMLIEMIDLIIIYM